MDLDMFLMYGYSVNSTWLDVNAIEDGLLTCCVWYLRQFTRFLLDRQKHICDHQLYRVPSQYKTWCPISLWWNPWGLYKKTYIRV